MTEQNTRILLRERPSGAVAEKHFQIDEAPLPSPGPGEALVKVLYLSIDPTIKGWIERDTYLPAVKIGDVVRSGGVAEVVESNDPKLSPGDRVFGTVGWQKYAIVGPQTMVTPLPPGVDPTDALSIFGITGMTAYFGMTDIGRPQAGIH